MQMCFRLPFDRRGRRQRVLIGVPAMDGGHMLFLWSVCAQIVVCSTGEVAAAGERDRRFISLVLGEHALGVTQWYGWRSPRSAETCAAFRRALSTQGVHVPQDLEQVPCPWGLRLSQQNKHAPKKMEADNVFQMQRK